jgi:hypothetical protein
LVQGTRAQMPLHTERFTDRITERLTEAAHRRDPVSQNG